MTMRRIFLAGGVWAFLGLSFFPQVIDAKSLKSANLKSDPLKSAKSTWPGIELNSTYRLVDSPLTTDEVSEFDSKQPNPHRQRWILNRKTKLVGLRAIPKLVAIRKGSKKQVQKFAPEAAGLISEIEGHIRGPGSWYQTFDKFNCEKTPDSWFTTEEGAKIAAGEAGEQWTEILSREKLKLNLLLDRVVGDTEKQAIEKAYFVFQRWLTKMDLIWRSYALVQARTREWKYYLVEAREQKFCPLKRRKSDPPSVMSLMEPLAGSPPVPTDIKARVPAKLWDGVFSVRLEIQLGGGTLNGRFLIDSSAPKSIISPVFLEGQGILPNWIMVSGAQPGRVQWSPDRGGGGGLAPWIAVDSVSISGLVLPLQEFLLKETELFMGPDYPAACCDGVLGNDFLRLFPIEFQTIPPYELRIWPKKNFQWSTDTPWVEASESPQGDFVSACGAENEDSTHFLGGARWDFGSFFGLAIHTPWQARIKNKAHSLWNVQCGAIAYAKEIHAEYPTSIQSEGILSRKLPAFTVGIALLERGNVTFDLPHGRIWFQKGSLTSKGIQKNNSGLNTQFKIMKNGERVLFVMNIKQNSPSKTLIHQGLRAGMRITEIDQIPVSDLDSWEVQRRLSGWYGKQISIQWKTKQGLKIAPIQF